MWRRAVFEGVDEEAELLHGFLWCEAEHLEHLRLQLAVMDTQRASADLYAVAYKVVGFGAHLSGFGCQQWYVVRVRHSERMVC